MKELIIKVDEEKMDISGNAPIVDKPQELVRCKGCKFAEEERCEIAYRFGEKGDWFCADGERK